MKEKTFSFNSRIYTDTWLSLVNSKEDEQCQRGFIKNDITTLYWEIVDK